MPSHGGLVPAAAPGVHCGLTSAWLIRRQNVVSCLTGSSAPPILTHEKSRSRKASCCWRETHRRRCWIGLKTSKLNMNVGKNSERNWAEREEHDKRSTAMHEAGHYVVAKHFKLDASCCILRVCDASRDNLSYGGHTRYSPTSKLRQAAVGWGAFIALEIDRREVAHEEFSSDPDIDFYDDILAMLDGEDAISESDANSIAGGSFRAFKIAWGIVFKNQARVKFMAEKMMNEPGVYQSENTSKSWNYSGEIFISALAPVAAVFHQEEVAAFVFSLPTGDLREPAAPGQSVAGSGHAAGQSRLGTDSQDLPARKD